MSGSVEERRFVQPVLDEDRGTSPRDSAFFSMEKTNSTGIVQSFLKSRRASHRITSRFASRADRGVSFKMPMRPIVASSWNFNISTGKTSCGLWKEICAKTTTSMISNSSTIVTTTSFSRMCNDRAVYFYGYFLWCSCFAGDCVTLTQSWNFKAGFESFLQSSKTPFRHFPDLWKGHITSKLRVYTR